MIVVYCPGCGQKLKAKETLAGKRLRCPGCGDPVLVPAAGSPDPAAPAPVQYPAPARGPTSAPGSPTNPFTFAGPTAAVETVPSMSFVDETGAPGPYPRHRRRSPVRAWTVHGAIVGALAGGLTMALLKLSDQKLVELILRPFPESERFKMAGTVMGAILGAMVGLAAAGMLVVLVGRSLESLSGALLIWIGGGLLGALRGGMYLGPGEHGEPGWAMLLLGTIGGTLAGMVLGVLTGAIISAASGPAPREF